VLPNNKNIILAAEQAASLVPEKHVTVLPSRSFAEGYYAIAMDIPDEKDLEKRIRGMRSGIDNIVTLRETTASRDYTYHEIPAAAARTSRFWAASSSASNATGRRRSSARLP